MKKTVKNERIGMILNLVPVYQKTGGTFQETEEFWKFLIPGETYKIASESNEFYTIIVNGFRISVKKKFVKDITDDDQIISKTMRNVFDYKDYYGIQSPNKGKFIVFDKVMKDDKEEFDDIELDVSEIFGISKSVFLLYSKEGLPYFYKKQSPFICRTDLVNLLGYINYDKSAMLFISNPYSDRVILSMKDILDLEVLERGPNVDVLNARIIGDNGIRNIIVTISGDVRNNFKYPSTKIEKVESFHELVKE